MLLVVQSKHNFNCKGLSSVVGVHFLGETAVFVLGEEALVFASFKGDEQRAAADQTGEHRVGRDRLPPHTRGPRPYAEGHRALGGH